MEIVEQQQTLTLDAIEQEAKAKYALAQHLAATAKDAARDAVLAQPLDHVQVVLLRLKSGIHQQEYVLEVLALL